MCDIGTSLMCVCVCVCVCVTTLLLLFPNVDYKGFGETKAQLAAGASICAGTERRVGV
ncbi:hypothetical protein THAOC_17747, partial [Thalassiosira oceanica]